MGIFKKTDPIDETLTKLCRKRDGVAATLRGVQDDCEKAQAAWESALDSDDAKGLERAGARLAAVKEFCGLLEAELDDCAQKISIAEQAAALAQNRAVREAKALIFDRQAKALPPLFDSYVEVAARFADELSHVEGVFDAEAAGSIVRQTAAAVFGAQQSILNGMRFRADELRRDPVPRAPAPLQLPRGAKPWAFGDRNDPHEPAVW